MSRRALKLLTVEQMEKLNTKRLLAYRNRLLSVVEVPYDPDTDERNRRYGKTDQEWGETYQACRRILGRRRDEEGWEKDTSY